MLQVCQGHLTQQDSDQRPQLFPFMMFYWLELAWHSSGTVQASDLVLAATGTLEVVWFSILWLIRIYCSHQLLCIRERGSVLYLGMATEILNLPHFCITQIMAKEATNPKPSMQREWSCLVVHKYTRERTFEYAGAEKQTAEKSDFVVFFLLSHTKLD